MNRVELAIRGSKETSEVLPKQSCPKVGYLPITFYPLRFRHCGITIELAGSFVSWLGN
jgi:hypothetical protein